ncbi:hypothetical protein pb186bvf_019681 [Paramecium bursaria]
MNFYCSKDGYHQGITCKQSIDEPLEMICLNEECIKTNQVLNCLTCVEEQHSGHQLIHYGKFIKLLQKQGQILLNEIEVKDGRVQNNDFELKFKQMIEQLSELQEQLNDQINRTKDKLQSRLIYFQQFQMILPQYDTFLKAVKTKDSTLVQKLITQFLSKVEYSTKRQDFNLRKQFIKDQSDEITGQNELLKRIKDTIDSLKLDTFRSKSDNNQSIASKIRKSNTGVDFYRDRDCIQEIRISSPIYRGITEKSPGMSPGMFDDKISVNQSLSQLYYKPRESAKLIGEQVPLIISQVPTNSQTIFTYHPEFSGEGISVMNKIVKLQLDADKRMALIKPPIYGSGSTRECKLKLQIKEKVCRNTNQRFPMAIGICDLDQAKSNQFQFSGFAEHIPGPQDQKQQHGCYLLNSNGVIRSPLNDMIKSTPNLRFYSNSVLELNFKPFHKLLQITRDNNVTTNIPIELKDGQKLYFCIRLADLHDSIEII